MGRLTVITTDLFPALARHLESGVVVGTLYQRPRSQGRFALRMLLDFIVEGRYPSHQLRLAPHLIMKKAISISSYSGSCTSSRRKDGVSSTRRPPGHRQDLRNRAESGRVAYQGDEHASNPQRHKSFHPAGLGQPARLSAMRLRRSFSGADGERRGSVACHAQHRHHPCR